MIQYITTYPGITYESYNLFISYGVLTLSKNSATTTQMRFHCLYIDVFILYHVRLQNKHYILFITVNKKQNAYCLSGKCVNIPIIQIFRTFGNVWFKEHKRMLAYFNTLSWFVYSCKRIRSITLRKLHLYVKCSFFDKNNCVRYFRNKAYVADMHSILMSFLFDITFVSGALVTIECRLRIWIRYWW